MSGVVTQPGAPAGPLAGVRVFDLTVWMVGPWASMQLGALGADVIHIEKPDTPPSELGAGVPPTIAGTSAGYIAWNMNKRGLGLDLKREEDQQIAVEVLRSCDVFLVNMRPGVADRLGLGYEAVAAVRPDVVYCSVTGWGGSGPLVKKPGSDILVQARSGFASLNGPEGERGQFYRHYAQLDPIAGEYAVQGILMALYQRRRTGRGQFVEVSMLESALTLQTLSFADFLATGKEPRPLGSASRMTAPDEALLCQDNCYVGVTVRNNDEWRRFGDVVDLPQSVRDDPRYDTNDARVTNRRDLTKELEPLFQAMPSEYWIQWLTKARLPCGYSLRFDVLRHHRQVLENAYLCDVETPWGDVTTGGSPWDFAEQSTRRWGPPLPGQHTEEILRELGIEQPGGAR